MRDSKPLLVIGLAAMLAGLEGCAGAIRSPSYYTLNVPESRAVGELPKPIFGPVAIRHFGAPDFLRRGPIVYRQSPDQLDFCNYHRWVEDPRTAVTRAMLRKLAARGLFKSVDLFDGHESPEYLVTGNIEHLEEVDRGGAVSIEVGVSAQLTDVRTGQVLWQDRSLETSNLNQRSVPSIVAGMSLDVKTAIEHLVNSMQVRLTKEI